jgi:hypothetical protein
MGSGFKDFAAGDILTAADVDGYLMRQTAMTFADASARDSALSGVLDEGMIAYLEDVNRFTFYDGSNWLDIVASSTVGTWTNYTPTLEQVATFGLSITSSRYARINDIVIYQGHITVASGTGTGGNTLFLSLPLSYGASGNGVIGNAWIFDASGPTPYHAGIYHSGSGKVAFLGDWSGGAAFGSTPSIAVGVNDQVRFSIIYETDA